LSHSKELILFEDIGTLIHCCWEQKAVQLLYKSGSCSKN
jgi:hypothetical protein